MAGRSRLSTRSLPGDDARFGPLIRATDHVAPYFPESSFQTYGRYTDAVKVIRAWVRGNLMALDRDTLLRLSHDRYRKGRARLLPASNP